MNVCLPVNRIIIVTILRGYQRKTSATSLIFADLGLREIVFPDIRIALLQQVCLIYMSEAISKFRHFRKCLGNCRISCFAYEIAETPDISGNAYVIPEISRKLQKISKNLIMYVKQQKITSHYFCG